MFSMNATKEAFAVLSGNLYSDPVLAVIRELSTNAFDAHKEAGVEEPFYLHVPTKSERFFDIRDYGNGIPEDLIYNIYTSFFTSTKTEDENQTGYFGLGSKTPFSIVEKYFVISYCEGKKKTYKMEKVNGLPTVEKVSEEDSNETGLEVKFDVHYDCNYDYVNWSIKAVNFFKGTSFLPKSNAFDEIPNFNWEDYTEEREFYSFNNCCIKDNNWRNEISINVAGVRFDVNFDQLPKDALEEVNNHLRCSSINKINIMAGKNDVSITPSREALHYDSKTVDFIKENVKNVIAEYFKKINNDFDNLNYFFCTKVLNFNHYDLKLNSRITDKINDLIFDKVLYVKNVGNGKSIGIYYNTLSNFTRFKPEILSSYIVDVSGIKNATKQNVVDNFYSLKCFNGSGKITSTAFANVVKSFNISDDYLVFFPKNKDSKKLDEIKKFLGVKAEIIKWTDFCDIKKNEPKRKIGFKVVGTEIYTWDGDVNKKPSHSYCPNNDPDLASDEVGIIEKKDCYSQRNNLRYCNALTVIGKPFKLVVRPCIDSVYEKYHSKGFLNIEEYFDKEGKENIDCIKDKLLKVKKLNVVKHISTCYFSKEFFDILNKPEYDTLMEDENFKLLRENYTKENFDTVYDTSLNLFNISVEGEIKISFDNYPIFKHIGNLDRGNIKDFLDYMIIYRNNEEKKTEIEIVA